LGRNGNFRAQHFGFWPALAETTEAFRGWAGAPPRGHEAQCRSPRRAADRARADRARQAIGATMVDGFFIYSRLLATLIIGVAALATTAHAQQVVVIVNGDPVTALDIEQRGKLNQLSTHKVQPRQETIEELIAEKLKIKEAKRWGLEISDSEVDQSYTAMAGRMRMTADQLTQTLARSGVNPATLKSRIRADMAWPQLVRGRFQSSIQVVEKDILTATEAKGGDVGYDYTLRQILFVV